MDNNKWLRIWKHFVIIALSSDNVGKWCHSSAPHTIKTYTTTTQWKRENIPTQRLSLNQHDFKACSSNKFGLIECIRAFMSRDNNFTWQQIVTNKKNVDSEIWKHFVIIADSSDNVGKWCHSSAPWKQKRNGTMGGRARETIQNRQIMIHSYLWVMHKYWSSSVEIERKTHRQR